MSSLEATTSLNTNSLVFEVNDNFDNDSLGIGLPHTSLNNPSRTAGNISPFERSFEETHVQKSSTKLKDLITGFSPSATASYFNQNFDENGYVFDGVKIEIEDIDNNSISNATTSQLKRCKKQVLKHYYRLLCFIGWRPIFKEDYYRMPCYWRLFNVFYPILIVLLLFFAYTYEIITCAGKLNVVMDTEYITPYPIVPAYTINHSHNNLSTKPFLTTTATPTTTGLSSSTSSHKGFSLFGNLFRSVPAISSSNDSNSGSKNIDIHINPSEYEKNRQCGHVVTTYIVPSIMHFIAYILGFIYFRISENEQLYSLMEKVFLAVNNNGLKLASQEQVIKRLILFIFFGALWVILAMSMQILERLAFGFGFGDQVIYQPYWMFLLIQAFALILMNSIYLAVVINHATQCELIIFYVNELRTRLEEKSITLKDAIQQILDVRISLCSLNSTVSKMTSLVALTFLEKVIIGVIILLINKNNEVYTWTYRGMFTFSWFIIFAFTIIQVARVNSKVNKFKQIALSSRVYGYGNNSRDELDSFLLFISTAKLRAKLFGVPLQPSYIIATCIVVTFTAIVLFQSSVFTPPDSFI